MTIETPSARIIRIHKKWSDGMTILWLIVIIAVFGGLFLLLQHLQVDPQDRNSSLILLATVTVISAIWQAAGLAVARIQMSIEGIDSQRTRGDHPRA